MEVHRYWLRLPVRSLTPSRLPKIRLGDILFGIAANHLREDHTKYMHRTAIQTHYLQHQIRNPPAHRHSRIYMTLSSTCFGNKFTALETQEHERGKVSVFFSCGLIKVTGHYLDENINKHLSPNVCRWCLGIVCMLHCTLNQHMRSE